jgi:hypothetical protein
MNPPFFIGIFIMVGFTELGYYKDNYMREALTKKYEEKISKLTTSSLCKSLNNTTHLRAPEFLKPPRYGSCRKDTS